MVPTYVYVTSNGRRAGDVGFAGHVDPHVRVVVVGGDAGEPMANSKALSWKPPLHAVLPWGHEQSMRNCSDSILDTPAWAPCM